MTDLDVTTETAAQQGCRDVDYVAINYAAHTLADSAIVGYWMESTAARTAHHDAEILKQIDKLTTLGNMLRVKVGAES